MRRLFTILAASTLLASVRAADDLPKKEGEEAMDFEPGLLPDLHAAPDPIGSIAKIETALERAKRNAAAGERMFRAGIIAKVEAEKRTLKIVRLTAELAAARFAEAKVEFEVKRAEFDAGKLSQERLDAAQTSADNAAETAAKATAIWQREELAAAELNLSRQRKLLAAGIGSRSLVSRAQSQVAGLKNKPPPAR